MSLTVHLTFPTTRNYIDALHRSILIITHTIRCSIYSTITTHTTHLLLIWFVAQCLDLLLYYCSLHHASSLLSSSFYISYLSLPLHLIPLPYPTVTHPDLTLSTPMPLYTRYNYSYIPAPITALICSTNITHQCHHYLSIDRTFTSYHLHTINVACPMYNIKFRPTHLHPNRCKHNICWVLPTYRCQD